MVVTGLVAGMLIFGKDFIRLWLGASYVSGPWTDRSDVIMIILVLANLPRMLQSISWQLLFAMARVRFLMWLNVCEAVANLSLSLLLVRRYGPAGVALGTLFPLLASHMLVMPVYISRTLKIPLLASFPQRFLYSTAHRCLNGMHRHGLYARCAAGLVEDFLSRHTCDCHTGRGFVPCLRVQPGGAQGATGAALAAAQWADRYDHDALDEGGTKGRVSA